jgi:mannose/fructose-specific phosphotransferase system component IIA
MNTITSPEKQGYRDFDLPTEHLLEDRHYVPPRAHDPSEIARRQELTPGTLLAETQLRGLQVARTVLENIDEEEGLLFAADMLAVSGINTAWYSYAQNSDVMRRRLKLPIMINGRSRSMDYIVEDSVQLLTKQVERARQLVVATDCQLSTRQEHQRRIGVGVGNFSLRLAMLEAVAQGACNDVGDNDELLQYIARRQALKTLERARQAHRVIGSHPSMAQLSDPYSHLSVYWYRHAPGSVQTAVADAL